MVGAAIGVGELAGGDVGVGELADDVSLAGGDVGVDASDTRVLVGVGDAPVVPVVGGLPAAHFTAASKRSVVCARLCCPSSTWSLPPI